MAERLDVPTDRKRLRIPRINLESEGVGRGAEAIARFSGTPQFLIYLTCFVILWIAWNTLAPARLQFDKAELGFTALTLMLSLQASYSAPLILLAQNRQTDRDRVQAEQDRQETQRNLSDTEYLTREIASLRMAVQDVATRDFVRSELRDVLDDLREELRVLAPDHAVDHAPASDEGGRGPAGAEPATPGGGSSLGDDEDATPTPH